MALERKLAAPFVLLVTPLLLLGAGASSFACGEAPSATRRDAGPVTGIFGSKDDAGAPKEGDPCQKDRSFYDIVGDGCDNDGDGTVDNPPACDDAETGATAESVARGMGICTTAAKNGYGIVSARFTQGYERDDAPAPEQHSVLPRFGPFGNGTKHREGERVSVLSTGYAQEFDGPDNRPFSSGRQWQAPKTGGNGTAPPGFPRAAEGCKQDPDVNDVIDLRLELKAPRNASGFAFDFNFYSGEWPVFVCSPYNDAFIAYLTAKSYNGGKPDNISFDAQQNPVSVNNGFFDRCLPNVVLGCGAVGAGISKCPGGLADLVGTGFAIEDITCANDRKVPHGGATGWLFSQAAIEPGETFVLELMIWDTHDGIRDSSVLLDNFRWVLGKTNGPVATTTDRPDDVK